MEKYKALVLSDLEDIYSISYEEIEMKELSIGELRIKIEFSSVNYKDRLAMNKKSRVVRSYPMVPGIDFSGRIVESNSKKFKTGDQVFVTGFGFGTDMPGGFREYIEINEKYVNQIPEGMTTKEAMIYGTAGFTAALSVDAIIESGIRPEDGPILVTGGSGGVAVAALLILKQLGFKVCIATRNLERNDYFLSMGADEVIGFSSLLEPRKALSKEIWASAVDATGGQALGNLLKEVKYGGVVALSGNLSGIEFTTSVFPFILRGITLKGIDSVNVDVAKKERIFTKLAKEWKSPFLEKAIRHEIRFSKLMTALEQEPVGEGRDLVVF
ncbi:MAG: acryloyl-CoA reductase [Clostridiaceae bacterium]